MINVSEETKQAIQDGTRTFNGLLDITLIDGTELESVTNTELMSYSVDDAVSEDNKFSALGGVVINQITFSLNNIDGDFSDYDFFDAEVEAYLTIGVPDEDPTVIRKGVYRVDDAVYTDKEIILTCLDNMAKFDRPYSDSTLVYPAAGVTLSEIILDLCDVCDVVLNTYDFPHKTYKIYARPGDEATTCREVLSYVAQIAGCYARCDNYGRLELKWFDTNALSTAMEDLTEQEEYVHYISSCYSCSVSTDDVVITGIEIAVEEKDADDKDVTVIYSSGTTGYVIRIEKNALINSTNAQEIANWLGVQLIGVSFRKANITHTGDPTIEAGDVAVLTDRKSNSYAIMITHTVFGIGTKHKTVCGAETPARNSSIRYKETTKNYVELRQKITQEKENRELALETLAERLDSKSAMYTTKEENASHQVIAWYLHDQPTLADSEYVWKMTTEAWGVSTDGGETWNGGMTVDGDTIVRILTATGIDASWINTGELVITNDGTEIFYANVETGVVRVSGSSITITAGDYLDNAINNTSKTVTRTILDNAQAYGLGLRVNKSGFSTDANGTCYYHGYSSLGNASNADGWVQWNGNRVTIPKGRHINPGSTMPFGVTVYNVYRTSDTSWHDVVWIESSNTWEANTYSGSTPSSRAAWTWNEATDIVLASYSIASSGAAITDAKLFTPPKKYSELAEVASMKAKLYTDSTLSDFATTINAEIDDIQAQLDGVVDTYYYAYTPTASNVPASAWTTQALKEEHEGDLFLDTSTGKSYRWVYESNTWQWKEIPDTASAQALVAAQNAQDTADHKRRVFLAEPTPPYDAGDLWMQGASGDILACVNTRSSGSYVSTDWNKLNKYTDDTATTALATRVTTLETETVAYYMEVSQAAVVKGTDGTYSPSTITVSATAQKISEALAAYAGWFKIETKTGSTWTSRYTTTGTAESSYTYTIPANTDAIRCSLYKESGLTTLLDQQTVPVVSDAKRGSGIYKVTTAPSSYTTETGGFTPTYRISLSTVLTQAGVSEVLVGDVLEYSYYHYPVGYVDSNYVYLGARTSIRGSQGAAGTNGTNGTNGTDGLNANIWTATANAVSPNYTFSISDLTGSTDTPRVGDIILRSYYRYTITSVGETTVLAGNRTSIRGAQGATGTAGTNNAVVTLYKRGSSAPSKPTTDLTYTFATGVLSGTLSDWSQTIPSGTDPVWAIVATASSNTATDTISSSEWSAQTKILENGVNGTSGTDGYNQATIYLYQRAASAPSKPSNAVTYTFSTGALSSTPSGWSRSIPAYDGNPCYVTTAAAISQNSTYSIASTAWSDVVKLAEDGTDGTDGERGTGIYKVTTAPSSYTTQTGGFTPTYRISLATVKSEASVSEVLVGDLLEYSYYHYPVGYVDSSYVYLGARQNFRGAAGAAGLNNATVTLYQRASSTPSVPSGDLTYTFATGVLSGTLGNWSQNIPSGDNPVYAIVATASATTATDTIGSSEWSTPAIILENGVDGINGTNGTNGTNGYNQATIYLYQRAASAPSKPSSAVTYTFSTGALSSIPSGWSRSIPASDDNPCYVTTAAAIGTGTTYNIASTAWSDVVKLVEDGEDGDDGADAYTVLLTNESHTFAGDETAALNATATSKVITYKGATQISCYAGSSSSATSISTGITGLTCTITSNNSQDVTLTFTASPDASHKLTTKSGTVTIPVHADGKTFNLIFSFSISLKGEDGADGEDAYYLETPFTWTNNGTIAEFEAIIYKGEEDVTSDYTNASFEWYLRNENGENRIAIGKTCSVAKSNLGYGSTITCVFTTYDNQNAQLLTRSGAGLQTRSGLRLTTFIQADGDQPITMLPYKTAYEVIHNDYLLGIDAADGYQVSVENFTENIVNSAFDTENLLTYPYTDTTTIVNDVTYVDNEDGSLEITGTASANAVFYLKSSAENFMLDPGVYHITQPNNASGSTIRVGIDGYKLGVYVKSYVSGASNRITILDTDDIDALVIWVIVYNGYTVSNYEFTPEIFSEVPTVSVRQALGDRIYRYGDTMEGGALQLRSYNISDTVPQTTQGGQCYVSFVNNDRHQCGWVQSKMTADGYCTIDVYARYPNTTRYAYLRLGTMSDGTQWVGVSSAAAWRTALGVVNKAGDTMSGNLQVSRAYDSHFLLKSTDVSTRFNATAPSANRKIGGFQHIDSNDSSNVVFYSETYYTTGQQQYTSFVTRRYNADASSSISHGFYLRINNDGTLTTNFTTAASRDAWATGLNVVKKAGDLMTGSLSMHNSDITIGTTPSSNYYGKAVVFEDSAGTDFGVVRGNYYSSGILGIQMLCQRTINGASRTNVLTLNVDTSGNATVGITGTNAAANWRSAIGAAASGSSSIRYKHDIKDMTDESLDAHKLYKLKAKQFVFNDDFDHLQYEDMKGQTLPGFIAEEVDEVYPSATIRKDGQIENWDERRLIPAMLKLIQEQHEEIKKLKQVVHVA